jgi:hypothetical protein
LTLYTIPCLFNYHQVYVQLNHLKVVLVEEVEESKSKIMEKLRRNRDNSRK